MVVFVMNILSQCETRVLSRVIPLSETTSISKCPVVTYSIYLASLGAWGIDNVASANAVLNIG